jgi:hypothetical protein
MKKSFPDAVIKGNGGIERSLTFAITGKETKEQ